MRQPESQDMDALARYARQVLGVDLSAALDERARQARQQAYGIVIASLADFDEPLDPSATAGAVCQLVERIAREDMAAEAGRLPISDPAKAAVEHVLVFLDQMMAEWTLQRSSFSFPDILCEINGRIESYRDARDLVRRAFGLPAITDDVTAS